MTTGPITYKRLLSLAFTAILLAELSSAGCSVVTKPMDSLVSKALTNAFLELSVHTDCATIEFLLLTSSTCWRLDSLYGDGSQVQRPPDSNLVVNFNSLRILIKQGSKETAISSKSVRVALVYDSSSRLNRDSDSHFRTNVNEDVDKDSINLKPSRDSAAGLSVGPYHGGMTVDTWTMEFDSMYCLPMRDSAMSKYRWRIEFKGSELRSDGFSTDSAGQIAVEVVYHMTIDERSSTKARPVPVWEECAHEYGRLRSDGYSRDSVESLDCRKLRAFTAHYAPKAK